MSDRYVLYGGGPSRSIIVEMLMAEADIPYELRVVDPIKGEHRTEEYLRINPAGYTPALITPEGKFMHETAAILFYLCEQHEITELMPMPGDPDRGLFLTKFFYHTNDIQPPTKRWFYPHRFTVEGDAGRDAIMGAARTTLVRRWGVLNTHLEENGPYHLGERYSLLDMHLAMWASYGWETTDDITDRFPAVRKVMLDTMARPKSGEKLVRLLDELRLWQTRTGHHAATVTGAGMGRSITWKLPAHARHLIFR